MQSIEILLHGMAMTKYTTNEAIWQRLQSPLDIAVERIRLLASANQMSVDELLVSLYTLTAVPLDILVYQLSRCFYA